MDSGGDALEPAGGQVRGWARPLSAIVFAVRAGIVVSAGSNT